MATSRRRLAVFGSHIAAAEETEPVKVNKQAPGRKGQGDHASNQSMSTRTVSDVQRFQMDTKGWCDAAFPSPLHPFPFPICNSGAGSCCRACSRRKSATR